jgi:hypothetical protein
MAGNHWHHGPARSSPKVAKSLNVGLFAVIVGSSLRLLARNVSRKRPLFAGPGAAVCKPRHLRNNVRRFSPAHCATRGFTPQESRLHSTLI